MNYKRAYLTHSYGVRERQLPLCKLRQATVLHNAYWWGHAVESFGNGNGNGNGAGSSGYILGNGLKPAEASEVSESLPEFNA